MRSKPFLVLALINLLAFPVSALAYLDDYSPFSGKPPKSFPLTELVVIESREGFQILGSIINGRNVPLIKLSHFEGEGDYFSLLSIYNISGNLVKDSVKVSASPHWNGAYMADLNSDGNSDFVIEIGSVATGLGTYQNYIVFALSSGKSYEVATLHNWDSNSVLRDFVDIKRNGSCQFIHTSFTYIEDKKGRAHSHWVYNLLEIKGTKLVLANHVYQMFPKWVWYTHKPNHKASPFISRAKAIEWSKSEYPLFFWKAGKEGGAD